MGSLPAEALGRRLVSPMSACLIFPVGCGMGVPPMSDWLVVPCLVVCSLALAATWPLNYETTIP